MMSPPSCPISVFGLPVTRNVRALGASIACAIPWPTPSAITGVRVPLNSSGRSAGAGTADIPDATLTVIPPPSRSLGPSPRCPQRRPRQFPPPPRRPLHPQLRCWLSRRRHRLRRQFRSAQPSWSRRPSRSPHLPPRHRWLRLRARHHLPPRPKNRKPPPRAAPTRTPPPPPPPAPRPPPPPAPAPGGGGRGTTPRKRAGVGGEKKK